MKFPDTAAFGHRAWPAQAGALTLIRGEVRRWLAPLEVLAEAEADLVLAVNEAAANVIDHAYRTGDDTGADRAVVEVFFWTEPGAVLFEVVDHGRWRPPGSHTASRGHGIEIMQRLVDAVLIHHDARGTRVLMRHSLPGHQRTVLPDTASPAARARRPTNDASVESGVEPGDEGRGVAATEHRDVLAEPVVPRAAERAVNRVGHRARTPR